MCVVLAYAAWVLFQAMAYIIYFLALAMFYLIIWMVKLPFIIAAALIPRSDP